MILEIGFSLFVSFLYAGFFFFFFIFGFFGGKIFLNVWVYAPFMKKYRI